MFRVINRSQMHPDDRNYNYFHLLHDVVHQLEPQLIFQSIHFLISNFTFLNLLYKTNPCLTMSPMAHSISRLYSVQQLFYRSHYLHRFQLEMLYYFRLLYCTKQVDLCIVKS